MKDYFKFFIGVFALMIAIPCLGIERGRDSQVAGDMNWVASTLLSPAHWIVSAAVAGVAKYLWGKRT